MIVDAASYDCGCCVCQVHDCDASVRFNIVAVALVARLQLLRLSCS